MATEAPFSQKNILLPFLTGCLELYDGELANVEGSSSMLDFRS